MQYLLCDLMFQEKNELKSRLAEAESYKSRYFKKEEENDEFEDLATMELAKVKHLVARVLSFINLLWVFLYFFFIR